MTAFTELQASTQLKHQFSQDSLIYQVWGQGPSARYDELAAHFRPIFERIRATTKEREKNHVLAYEQLQWLKEAGFTRLRLPVSHNGFEATIPELFALLIELAQADANLPQALRVHFGFCEDILLLADSEYKRLWLERIGQGQTIGSAWSEGGQESIGQFSTHLSKTDDGRVLLNGKKYYTTGSLYAEWIDVGISDLNGESASIIIPRHSEGVEVIDDWNGFGQVLTASGTTIFNNVEIDATEVLPDADRFKYSAAYYQLIQLAIITGLNRSATYEVSKAVEKRTRNYSHANTQHVRHDAQILQVVGKIRGAAYTSAAIIEKNAQALQRAFDSAFLNDAALEDDQNAIAELEVAQSQTIISDLALHSATIIFDALGASATDKNLALDRYWRNIRTLASHNPRIYKDRIVGDFSVNGTLPPYQWRIGQV